MVAALFSVLIGVVPGAQAHHQGTAHSGGMDTSHSYRGVSVLRWDNTMANIPLDGCGGHFQGHPMLQTQWVIIGGTGNWIEIGTGHQCDDAVRYWFWGYGYQGAWTAIASQGISGAAPHTFRVSRGSGTAWDYQIDVTTMGTVFWDVHGVRVDAGLESQTATGQTLNNGQPGTQNYDALQYRNTGNSWTNWAGRDGTLGPNRITPSVGTG